jgi:hypothetical protein
LTGLDIAFRLPGLSPNLAILLMSGAVLPGLEEQEALKKAGIKVFINTSCVEECVDACT